MESTRIFDYGRGHRHRQTLGKRTSRGQPCTRAAYTLHRRLQLLASSFAYRTPYRTQDSSFLIDFKGSASYKLIRFLFHPRTMGKSKASKRLKPSFSGEDLDSPSRAKRYALKLFSILPLGLTRVGLSISFGITKIFEIRLLDLLAALFLRI